MNLVRGLPHARFLTRCTGQLCLVQTGERLAHRSTIFHPPSSFAGISYGKNQSTILRNIPVASAIIDQKRLMASNRNKVKQPPTKPLSFDWGGDRDLTPVVSIQLSEPTLEFEEVPELETADPLVKKLLSLEFADGRAKLEKELDLVLRQIQEHPGDFQSLEARIAKSTVHIRKQIRHCLEFRKDKKSKVKLLEALRLRTKNLKKLQQYDIERFNWIQEELGIKYNRVPQYNRKISKRSLRKQIAREACWAAIEEKINNFKSKLEVERQEFEVFKRNELDDISEELKSMGLELKPSIAETILALDPGKDILKKEPVKKRRTALLEKKFELYGLRNRDRGSDARIKFQK